MEQLCIFGTPKVSKVNRWKLFIDGAARNNPGPAGAGVVIKKDDTIMQEAGFYLGKKTNNQAEYLALLLGIFLIKKLMESEDQLLIISDSQLLVRQLKGVYKVKDAQLKKLFDMAKRLLAGISCQVHHVMREENTEADAMANKGIDTKHAVPEAFVQLLHTYQIEWQ